MRKLALLFRVATAVMIVVMAFTGRRLWMLTVCAAILSVGRGLS